MTIFYHSSRYSQGSGKSILKNFKFIFSLASLLALVISSCEEDPTLIGRELLPPSDFVKIESTDTIRPVSFTMYDDSVSSENPTVSYLGQLRDPYFGTTTAEFVTQVRLKEDWDGGAWTVDSIKLYLELINVQGGVGSPHTLTIQEIAKDLSTTEKYYTSTKVPLAPFKMDIILPRLKEDSINSLELKLNDLSFANRLLADTSKLFHSNKVADFRSYFKGLHFKITSTEEPMMTAVSLVHSNSSRGYLIIDRYYKNFFVIFLHDGSGNKKAYYLILDAVNKNANFSLIRHDFTTAEPGNRIPHYNSTSYRDTLTYLQSLNGVYTRIVFPGLANLKKSGNLANIAVNKARLTVPFYSDNNDYKPSAVPGQLYLRYRTVKGTKPFVPDIYVDERQLFYDGLADTTRRVYNFNIATFVQNYLEDTTGDILPELELVQGSGTRNLILRANASSKPVRFDLTYTRF